MTDSTVVNVEEDENLVTISLNRPEKLNALNESLVEELHSIWSDLKEDPEKAVLLTGAGDVTCAGADQEIIEDNNFSASKGEYERQNQEIFQMIQTYPLPTVMACKGAAVGAGFCLAMECDFAVLGEETTFQYPETQLGLFSNRYPKLLAYNHGAQIAREVIMKSEPIPPIEAYDLGLVTDVVPEDEVDSYARELICKLAAYDDEVIRLLKRTLEFEFDVDQHIGYP